MFKPGIPNQTVDDVQTSHSPGWQGSLTDTDAKGITQFNPYVFSYPQGSGLELPTSPNTSKDKGGLVNLPNN